jgi:hypothetical protein
MSVAVPLLFSYAFIAWAERTSSVALQSLVDLGLLAVETSRSHSVGLVWTNDQSVAETCTDIHAPGGIRTRNPGKQAAAHARLRPRGRWNRPETTLHTPFSCDENRGLGVCGETLVC